MPNCQKGSRFDCSSALSNPSANSPARTKFTPHSSRIASNGNGERLRGRGGSATRRSCGDHCTPPSPVESPLSGWPLSAGSARRSVSTVARHLTDRGCSADGPSDADSPLPPPAARSPAQPPSSLEATASGTAAAAGGPAAITARRRRRWSTAPLALWSATFRRLRATVRLDRRSASSRTARHLADRGCSADGPSDADSPLPPPAAPGLVQPPYSLSTWPAALVVDGPGPPSIDPLTARRRRPAHAVSSPPAHGSSRRRHPRPAPVAGDRRRLPSLATATRSVAEDRDPVPLLATATRSRCR